MNKGLFRIRITPLLLEGFFDKIEEAIKEMFANMIITNMNDLVVDLNNKTAEIATEVAKGPSEWNGSVFSIIQTLSNNVILPIAGLILTYVLVSELYHIAIEQNNMRQFGVEDIFKWLFKAMLFVFIVANTTKIVMGLFDLGAWVIEEATGTIGSMTIDIGSYDGMKAKLMEKDVGYLILMMIESLIIKFMIMIIAIIVTVLLYGRMIELYLYISVAPIPFATFGNRELSSIGQNYTKGLVATIFQGFFIMVIVAIYGALVSTVGAGGEDIHETLMEVAISSLVLLFVLLKSGSISKSIFGAH